MRQFVADAGHQLRTPLTVIMGHLSGLSAKERLGDASIVRRMLEESRRMKTLIDDLILLAKLEHPQTEKTSLVDANELVERVAISFSGFDERRISVFFSDEPAQVLVCDSEMLGSVTALVDNALKYSQRSPVSISVLANRESVTIQVEDDGPGLSENDRAHIFDRFYRGETSAGIVGTGLGLAIVRRATERAGGSTTVENRTGGGLRCRIILPAVPTDSKTRSLASVS
jgi:two-component system OmpR family sensor kinase